MYAGVLAAGEQVEQVVPAGRHAWVQVARGVIELDGETLRAGDGAAIREVGRLTLRAVEPAEVLLFDLA
jgi:quercetin 2,3-dioxygenase